MATDDITISRELPGFRVTQHRLDLCHLRSSSSRSGTYGETV
jgi:hypothetical protein